MGERGYEEGLWKMYGLKLGMKKSTMSNTETMRGL